MKWVILSMSVILIFSWVFWYIYQREAHRERVAEDLKLSPAHTSPPVQTISTGQSEREKDISPPEASAPPGGDKSQTVAETSKDNGEGLTEEDVQALLDWLGEETEGQAPERSEQRSDQQEELSSEMKRKVELYAELAGILPDFKWAWTHSGPKSVLEGGTPVEDPATDLLNEILELCDPIIGPPAVRRDERGVIQAINLAPMFAQVAEYLGKELPFDGNPDYFSAEDYKGGTGGW